jgi:polysaccharide biosynthesis protein PslH
VVAAADLVTVISDDDGDRFRAEAPSVTLLTVPPGYGGERLPDRVIDASVPRRAVIVGNLDWHVKQMNLLRFLEVADERFAAAAAEIVVVGPVPDEFRSSVQGWAKATTFRGRVESLDAELAGARVGLVAEPAGGGFKLKGLDYVFRRVPVAVLAGSMTGMPLVTGRSMLECADNLSLAMEALAAIDDLPRLNALQREAFDATARAFDWDVSGTTLHAAIAELVPAS